MNLSKRWLDKFVKIDTSAKDFSEAMTMSGSKVEGFKYENDEIKNVVVGQILSLEKHPDADKLQICQIDVGKDKPLQIVTAAKNIKVEDKVPVALDGAYLKNGQRIFNGKLRGVDSFGMLCSVAELGLSTNDFPYAIEDGIFVIQEECNVGDDVCKAIGLDDLCVEFEITSNRPDCFSVIGLAREAAATYKKEFNLSKPQIKNAVADENLKVEVSVKAPDLCPCYCSRVVKDVKVEPSPRWLRELLRTMGVRPINNIVDITNFVMLEYGQPMHAFDYNNISGQHIIVRRAKNGEMITTLDDTEHKLNENQLVIADENKPIAIAGVMGGEFSSINDNTNTIVFESANFKASSVRKTAKAQGMRTDSSALYEKGLDPNNCIPALNRACELIEMLNAGTVIERTVICKSYNENKLEIPFSPEFINGFLGTEITKDEMVEILRRVDCEVKDDVVIVPTFRPDLEDKADIAEEIARFFGYDKIASSLCKGVFAANYTPYQSVKNSIANLMISAGYSDIVTYSFISPKEYDKILLDENDKLRNSVRIQNPLGEDTSVMRSSVIPSMLSCLARNYSSRNMNVRLYEIAKEYIKTTDDELPDENERLVLGAYGENEDFFAIKGVIEDVLDKLGIKDYDIKADSSLNYMHPGRCAKFYVNDKQIGMLGEVHPIVCENYNLPKRVYVADFDTKALYELSKNDKVYKPLPKYPAVLRDISLLCSVDVPVLTLQKIIVNSCGDILEKVELFDVYQSDQLGKDKKSVAFSITLRSQNETLKENQINDLMDKLIGNLKSAGAVLRS
ncbi:MAG: phenylalanine--tRNA ligase subunit beta [Clostridia bacterium]|nr:phenylalanine--tRNA ligase subunit beta [Clostridia bacterium]